MDLVGLVVAVNTAWDGADYQRRFDELKAGGTNVHGEADFVEALGVKSVLDAGCGTGRVAIELHRRGLSVVGVDRDPSMLSTASSLEPSIQWYEEDISAFDLKQRFEAVVMAGNVLIFADEASQVNVVASCALHMQKGSYLVSGFQLGKGYDLKQYDSDCAQAGLVLAQRWSTWAREEYFEGSDYAVSVHRPQI